MNALEFALRLAILQVLDEVGSYTLGEPILFLQCNLRLPGRAAAPKAIKAELEELRKKGFVDYEIPRLGGPKEWRITAEGREEIKR